MRKGSRAIAFDIEAPNRFYQRAQCPRDISAKQFQILAGSDTQKRDTLTAGIPERETAIQKLRNTASNTDSFIARAKRYTAIPELPPELLGLFIQKIVVHEKSVK